MGYNLRTNGVYWGYNPLIIMEHNHGGFGLDHFPFDKWVICRFQPFIFQEIIQHGGINWGNSNGDECHSRTCKGSPNKTKKLVPSLKLTACTYPKRKFLFQPLIFRGENVSFRGDTIPKTSMDTQNDGLEKVTHVTPFKHGKFWYLC